MLLLRIYDCFAIEEFGASSHGFVQFGSWFLLQDLQILLLDAICIGWRQSFVVFLAYNVFWHKRRNSILGFSQVIIL